MEHTQGKIPSAREIYDLKEQAKLYYGENKVPERMEDILNSMFYDNPLDIYGHLVCILICYSSNKNNRSEHAHTINFRCIFLKHIINVFYID